MKTFRVVCALFCACGAAFAVETKTWTQAGMADFDKGSLTGLSISSEGKLTLAPVVKEVFDGSAAFLWAVARDSKGNLFAGSGGLGGSKVKLFEVDAAGKVKTLAELDGIGIQALAIDRNDRVYAATSPDGKVYRVDASGKADVFYDPKAKYIWALAFDKTGNLYVATGDQGEIHRVTPAGAGSVFFKTEETHARSLVVDANGNLIVGTEPGGLILRVSPTGQGFVLYQAPKREITAVAVAADGTIYGAGVGTKQSPTQAGQPPPAPAPAPPPRGALPQGANPAVPAVTGGSEIYRIQADGYPRKVWSDAQDLVYALAFDARGKLIAGTGNRGYLYRIDDDHTYTRLRNLASTEITGLAAAPNGTLYAVTGNIGKMFAVGPALEASGTYESDVLDAGSFTYWGRVTADPEKGVVFETRSGNVNRPQQNWSGWEKLKTGRIASPPARFLEYRATLSGAANVDEVDVAYQMKNVAPVIEETEITPANYKFPAAVAAAGGSASPATLSLPALGRKNPSGGAATPAAASSSTPALSWAKGQIGARWLSEDDNGDTLTYKVEIRGVNETTWKLVRDKVRENYLSWDSTSYPDGKYVVRITASDALSNPPDQALESSRETDWFLIDNTPPVITMGPVTGTTVTFTAKDALSVLGKAEYSVNGGDWQVAEPTTRLTDSMEHEYRVDLPRAAGERTVAVRIEDAEENQATAKVVLK